MGDTGRVDAVERHNQRREDGDRLPRVEGAAAFQQLGERAAGQSLEDEHRLPGIRRDIVERDDVVTGRSAQRVDLDLSRRIVDGGDLQHDGASLVEAEQEAGPVAVPGGPQYPVARDILHSSGGCGTPARTRPVRRAPGDA